MTGPVYIEGANPGDTLKIEVLDIALPLDYGWIGATPGRGPLGDRIPAFRKTRVKITPEGVIFNDRIIMPLRPMIGRIGVAPHEEARRSNEKGEFGGGMGNTQITKGSTVYLPVFHAGGLLTIGDCHAAMGDGEATASAVECAFDATFRVTIAEHFTVRRPVVTTATDTGGPARESRPDRFLDVLVYQLSAHITVCEGVVRSLQRARPCDHWSAHAGIRLRERRG
jgi:amidase